jgi:hypothetical protein
MIEYTTSDFIAAILIFLVSAVSLVVVGYQLGSLLFG